jgi:hypothetical protein
MVERAEWVERAVLEPLAAAETVREAGEPRAIPGRAAPPELPEVLETAVQVRAAASPAPASAVA